MDATSGSIVTTTAPAMRSASRVAIRVRWRSSSTSAVRSVGPRSAPSLVLAVASPRIGTIAHTPGAGWERGAIAPMLRRIGRTAGMQDDAGERLAGRVIGHDGWRDDGPEPELGHGVGERRIRGVEDEDVGDAGVLAGDP